MPEGFQDARWQTIGESRTLSIKDVNKTKPEARRPTPPHFER